MRVWVEQRESAMLRTGFLLLMLFAISGCASMIGDEPGSAGMQTESQGSALEKADNKNLSDEKAALNEAIRHQQAELNRLDASE